jgi:hypothetical protein
VIPDVICAASGAILNFSVSYDTQLDNAAVSPRATVYQNSIYDNIGLFRNPAWIAAPDLLLTISQAGSAQPVTRVDLTKAVFVS